ncbi:NUDIX domain-containing protein [Nonomuraea dietziae]|uniref:NUDIX domain-containing protein n=1 Tax=Nonomuraea dietziae TaxID=65515 RepID=UPI0033E4AD8F
MSEARPAARVVCLDRDERVLLMHWLDRVSRQEIWEPPGGGLDAGETPLEAARRELTEETGLPGDAVQDRWVAVDRDFTWLGVHYVKVEPFYVARFDEARPAVDPGELTEEESEAFLGYGWFGAEELGSLPGHLDPPELPEVIRKLR